MRKSKMRHNAVAPALESLPPYDDDGVLQAVVETPKASTYKMKFDAKSGAFHYQHPLPLGLAYPYDWGFIPGTIAPDGDPLDVLVLHDAATHPGVVIPCRVMGMVRISQKDRGEERVKNDRVLAVPLEHATNRRLSDLTRRMRDEISAFFLSCTQFADKKVCLTGWGTRSDASRAIARAHRVWRKRERKER